MDRKAFIEKLTAKLKEWDAEIDILEVKAQEKEAVAKMEYTKRIKELQDKKEEAQQKLEEVKNANKEAWEELKIGAEKAMDDISDSFKSVMDKLK